MPVTDGRTDTAGRANHYITRRLRRRSIGAISAGRYNRFSPSSQEISSRSKR
jgi:hypothetical protein